MEQLSFPQAPRPPRTRWRVLPDSARVEERLRALARQNRLVAGRVALSVAELERELVRSAQRAGRCPQVASPEAMLLALREAARDHSSGPYQAVREQPGYVRALSRLRAALGQGLVDPEELSRLEVPDRVAALGRTLAAFRALLDRAGLVEPHRALRLALQHHTVELPQELEFDGILDWTPLRLQLAQALCARAQVRILLPWAEGRPELNAALEPALRALESLGEGPAPEVRLVDPAEGGFAPFLRQLFSEQPEPADAEVALISCASPAAQAREVARRCAALLSAGAAPDSIAVAARTLGEGVAEEIQAALDRAGIPWRERRGRPALPAPPVQLALSLARLLEEDFPREPLIELLSSRLLWLREGGERLPPQALARRLREAHCRDDEGGGGYAARLAELRARLEAKGLPCEDLAEVAERVGRILSAVRGLQRRATHREHGAALLGLLGRWNLQARLRAPEPAGAAPGLERAALSALARDQAALQRLEECCAGLARAAAQLGMGERRIAFGDWTHLLAEALAGASLPPGGAKGGAVQLVELRELSGRSFEHLLVVGLVDGALPQRAEPDPLLSDDEKRAVNRAVRRAVFRDRQAEEPLLFQLALGAARASAALLWPRADGQGRELVRSAYVDEVARALGRSAEGIALSAIPPAEGCAGPAELLARTALDAFADPAYRVTPPGPPEDARRLAGAVRASSLAPRLRRIARAAAAERERVLVFTGEIAPGRFSGQLSGRALETARPRFDFGPERPLSARQLEQHALCGFRTFGQRLLHLSPEEEDDDELGNRERGILLHRCLERFFRRVVDEGRAPDDVALLREVAAEEIAAFAEREHVGHRGLWELKGPALVEELAEVVAEQPASPVAVEQAFGYPEGWPALRIGDFHVRGKIDRIDRLPSGGLRIIDYKSGAAAGLRRKLKEALAPQFQLALYEAAARQQHPEAQVEARYLSIRDAELTPPFPDVQQALPGAVQERVERMRGGTFPARPLSCDSCDLKPACRLVALPTDPDEEPARA